MGELTDPWNNQWLPKDGMLRPFACINTVPAGTVLPRRVSDFINGTTVTWNEEKLRQFLLPMDVEVAMQIPLNGHRHDDFWSWHYDRRGAFTVRSAYKMLVATQKKGSLAGEPGFIVQWRNCGETMDGVVAYEGTVKS
jgi:hypothetical protein